MYQKIALVLYFITLIASLSLAIMFKLSKSGPFRNQFMFYFMSMAWALLTRLVDVSGIWPVDLLFVMLPLTITSVWLVWSIANFKSKQ